MPLPFEQILLADSLVASVFFIVSYFLLGSSVKFIDDAFDEHTFSRKIAFILSPITAIFWAYVMALHPASAMILTAIVIGVLVKGKIDTLAFVVAVLCVYLAFFFMGSFDFIFTLTIPLVIISLAGILDEIGNDYVDANNVYHKHKPFGKYIHLFFEYRFVMKLTVLLFALLNAFAFYFFLAFFAWDIGYAVVMKYSKKIAINRKFYYTERDNNNERLWVKKKKF